MILHWMYCVMFIFFYPFLLLNIIVFINKLLSVIFSRLFSCRVQKHLCLTGWKSEIFFRFLLLKGSWDSIVGVVIGLQPGRSGIEISGMSILALQTTQLHIRWVPWTHSSRVN
jgi:hypothetical protein